jgi:transcriptional regulator of heat shock response
MTTKHEEMQMRKDRILGVTVQQYIHSISPVSSETIVRESRLDISSATVRNILADLEKEGYLTHPHTSAGRVPTQMGYRYYVDHLMNEIQLLANEKEKIKDDCARQSLELDDLLQKTSQVVSDTTHYTSIISVDGWGSKIFCYGTSYVASYPDYQQDLQKIYDILKALEEKERLLEVINREIRSRIKIYIGREMACSPINSCSLVISRYKMRQGPTGRIAILGPTRMNYERVISTLDYVSQLMEENFSYERNE